MTINYKTLDDLWAYVYRLNEKHFPENKLMPILGDGKKNHPKIMFVFINPTFRNISSNKNWKGPRFPFIGTKQIWRIFHRAGLLNDELINRINKDSNWSLAFTNEVLKFLIKKEFYFTNLVKWTGLDATLPESEKIKLFLPILEKEIEIVQPKYIVAFGLMPFYSLTKQKIKLLDYYHDVVKNGNLKSYNLSVSLTHSKVIPCYFPTGRGNPKRAVELLQLVKKL
ncbi:MAG: uracil-DNA glycosylase family protein [Nanoarchaeota archaeon]